MLGKRGSLFLSGGLHFFFFFLPVDFVRLSRGFPDFADNHIAVDVSIEMEVLSLDRD